MPLLLCFGPSMLMLGIALTASWARNDFALLASPKLRSPPFVPLVQALLTYGMPRRDVLFLTGLALEGVLLIAFGHALNLRLGGWHGWVTAYALAFITFTLLPAMEWFHTFSLSLPFVLNSVLSVILFAGGAVVYFVYQLDSQASEAAMELLFFVLLCPAVSIFWIGMLKWRDDNWQLSRTVAWTNLVALLLLSALLFVVAIAWEVPKALVLVCA